MRQHMCICLSCREKSNLIFEEPYPEFGDQFIRFCKHCKEETIQTMELTNKISKELRKQKKEEELKESIRQYCQRYGFTCRFLYESVIITTPISSWQFQYHSKKKTLRHESTVKVNYETGDYAKTHKQFVNKKMTCEEIIDYIADHDDWRQKHNNHQHSLSDT